MLFLALGLIGFFSAGAQAAAGTAMGWGDNSLGQVGDGTTSTGGCACVEAPEPVKGLSGATQIAVGRSHALALLANGTVMAWGNNTNGQLGNGTAGGADCGGACSAAPVQIPGFANVVAVAAGDEYSLALLANGTVMAWGDNARGELGNGSTSAPECGGRCSEVPVRVPGLANVVAVAAGINHSLALLADGTVMTWGLDVHGEAGDGTGAKNSCRCIDQPTPVPGVSAAVAISAGRFGGLALLADGTIKAWGFNFEGELGRANPIPPPECRCLGPVSVPGLVGVRAIAAGGSFNLAKLSDGSVQAWGFNEDGELGNGGTTNNGCGCIPTPAPVSELSGPEALSAGDEHSLALLPNGTVRTWGFNLAGQLGDGTTEFQEVPTAISKIGGASGVFASASNSFALIGPSQTLKVSFAGAGAGTVGGPGILCPSGCEGRYPQSQVEILRAEPTAGSGFAGFSGPCTGTGACQVKLDQDQTVTATFGTPTGTAITDAKLSSPKKSAAFSFIAPGAITGFECELIKPKPAHKAHKPKGHRRLERAGHKTPKPRFSSCAAPKTYKHLKPGRYTFMVRALDILGPDANPALKRFTIKPHRAKKVKHRH